MTKVKDFVVSGGFLESAKMTSSELAIEIAVYLYANSRLTLGQAKRLAKLDQISFQKELATRNVFVHFETADLLKDAENLGIKL